MCHPRGFRRSPRAALAAFSFTEMMVSLAIVSVITAALIIGQLYGMRMFNITATKLGAAQSARISLSRVRDEIRSGKVLYVGNGDGVSFTKIKAGKKQQGDALRIFPGTDTNSYITYFLDADEQQLKRQASGEKEPETIASYITNTVVFYAEDFAGNPLTNDVNNRVIKLSMDFYQWEFPVAQAGAGAFYDFYHLQTRIARRAIE